MIVNNQKGQSIIFVLLITSTILFIGGAALTMGTAVRKTAAIEVNQEKAYYIAEAGIEKVIAESKNGPSWLKDLNVGSSYDFLANNLNGNNNYGDGTFEKINVKKLTENTGLTILEIESWGKCKGSIRKIKANVSFDTAYAENPFKGLWIKNGNTPNGHGVVLTINSYFSDGNTLFIKGSNVVRDIYCHGKVFLQSEEGNTTIIKGDIYALGGVEFTGNKPSEITGNIYVDDINKVPALEEVLSNTIVLPTAELSSKIPGVSDFPDLLSSEKLTWYQNNAHYYQLPSSSGSNRIFQNGIYYLNGEQSLSGTYSGNAIIVINGSVTLGNLKKNSDNDSLTILSTGTISSNPPNQEIHALIYSRTQIDFENGTTLKGCILSPNLAGQAKQFTVVYDENMFNRFKELLNWTTCFVKITKWSE